MQMTLSGGFAYAEIGCGIKDRRKGYMENTKLCFYANAEEAVKREKLMMYTQQQAYNYRDCRKG